MKAPAAALLAVVALAGCGGAGAPPPAARPQPASDLVPLTTAQAAARADRVALVVARGSRVIEGAPGTPFTRTRFTVDRVLKGRLPRKFVLQVVGGRLGDRVVESLVPEFTRSHRYVVFLGPDGPAGPTIFPQSVIEVKPGMRVGALLASIRRNAG